MNKEANKRKKMANISEDYLRELYEKIPVNYQSLDKNGNILRINKTWLKTLGYSEEEVIGKWFGDFLAPEYVKLFRERFPLFIEKRVVHDADFDMICKDGSTIHVSYEGATSENKKGEFQYTHCIFLDISKRVDAKEKLKKQNELLEHFNKMAVDRELQMVRLKNKIKYLQKKLGLKK